MTTLLKYHSTDIGHCRIYYKSEHGTLFCWQDELHSRPDDFELYVCTTDGEPVGVAKRKEGAIVKFEKPQDSGSLSAGLIQRLQQENML